MCSNNFTILEPDFDEITIGHTSIGSPEFRIRSTMNRAIWIVYSTIVYGPYGTAVSNPSQDSQGHKRPTPDS